MSGSFFNGLSGQKNGAGSTKKEKNHSSGIIILASILKLIRLKILELRYLPHLEIRLVHDKVYVKGGAYKKWTDNPKSQNVHRVSAFAFAASFIIFTLAQALFPVFNLGQPSPALAGSDTVTWSTTSEFTNNGVIGGNYSGGTDISPNIDTLGDSLSVKLVDPYNNLTDRLTNPSKLNAVSFPTSSVGYVGGTYFYKTVDGGETWVQVTIPVSFEILSIDFVTDQIGWITGGSYVLKTINGGDTWLTQLNSANIKTIDMFDVNNGYVSSSSSAVWKTTNGGTNWTSMSLNCFGCTFYNTLVSKNNSNIAITFADSYHRHTTNGGSSNWLTTSPSAFSVRGSYATGTSAWAVGDNGVVYKSTSYPTSFSNWGVKTSPGTENLKGVFFKDDNNGWVVGGSKIYKTVNGGTSWTDVSISVIQNAFYTGLAPVLGLTEDWWAVGDSSQVSGSPLVKYSTSYPTGSFSSSGFRVDNGTNFNSTWNQISWNGSEPTGTNIKFRTRGSNVENPSSMTGDAHTGWTYWNNDSSGTSYYENSGASIVTPKTRWLEVEATLETTDPTQTPTVNDFTVTSTLQAPTAGSLTQQKSDGSGFIDAEGWHNSGVKLSVNNVSGFEDATNFYGEFEVKPVASAFDGTGTVSGSTVSPGQTTESTVTKEPGDYKWRVRLYDSAGRVSPWTEFNMGNSAFQIDQSTPSGSIAIGGANVNGTFATANTVDLTFSDATDSGGSSPAKTDLFYRLSNSGDGAAWTDWTAYPANDTVSNWDLTNSTYGGTTDQGTKDVYLQFRDIAGNTSGTWRQTTQEDFDEGTTDNITTETGGDFHLSEITLPPDTVDNGNGTWTTNIYPTGDGWLGVMLDTGVCGHVVYSSTSFYNLGYFADQCSDAYENYTPQMGKAFQKFSLAEISGNINEAYLKNYWLQVLYVGGSADTVVDHIADYGILDSNDDSTAIYTNNIGTLHGDTGPVGYSNLNVTNYVQNDKANSRDYSSYKFYQSNLWKGVRYNSSRAASNKPFLAVTWTPTNGSGYYNSGHLESSTRDNIVASNYGAISWSADVPTETGADALRFQVATNNDNATWDYIGPDGTVNSYYTTSGTQLHSSHNNNQYIRYKAYLQTADGGFTPTVYDVAIEVTNNISASITLDTTKPTLTEGALTSPTGG